MRALAKQVRRMRPERKLVFGNYSLPDTGTIDAGEQSTYSATTGLWTGWPTTGKCFFNYQFLLNKVPMHTVDPTSTAPVYQKMAQRVTNYDATSAVSDDSASYTDPGGTILLPKYGIRIGNEMRMWNFTMRIRMHNPVIKPGGDLSTGYQVYTGLPQFGRVWVALLLVNSVPTWDTAAAGEDPGDPNLDYLGYDDLFEPPRFPVLTTAAEAGEGIVGTQTPFSSPAERLFYARRRKGTFSTQQMTAAASGVPNAAQQSQYPRMRAKILWQKKIIFKPQGTGNDGELNADDWLYQATRNRKRDEKNFGVKIRFKGMRVQWADSPGEYSVGADDALSLRATRALDSRPVRNQLRLVYWDNFRTIYPGGNGSTGNNYPVLVDVPDRPRMYFEYHLGMTDS